MLRVTSSSSAPGAATAAAELRAALSRRVVKVPSSWPLEERVEEGPFAFLCRLAVSIDESISAVHEAATVARSKLRDSTDALHAALESRRTELEQHVNHAEAAKVAAFEQERVNVDNAIAQWQTVHEAVEATTSLSDPVVMGALSEDIAALENSLPLLPNTPLESTQIQVGFETNVDATVAAVLRFGLVLAAPLDGRALSAGVLAPLLLATPHRHGMYHSGPSISLSGMTIVPGEDRFEAPMFSPAGAILEPLSLRPLGLSNQTRWASFCEKNGGDTRSLLLLADRAGETSRIIAVDPTSRAAVWSRELGDPCCGVATLPRHGVAIVAVGYYPAELRIISLQDGAVVGKVVLRHAVFYVAADASSGTIFVGNDTRPHEIHAWSLERRLSQAEPHQTPRWRLVPRGVVHAAGDSSSVRPLAVMPPPPGKRTSHLVVGTLSTSRLHVLALPSLALVHEHILGSESVLVPDTWGVVGVAGLAADPWGMAIAVCDNKSHTVGVLAWPLPGMPPLA